MKSLTKYTTLSASLLISSALSSFGADNSIPPGPDSPEEIKSVKQTKVDRNIENIRKGNPSPRPFQNIEDRPQLLFSGQTANDDDLLSSHLSSSSAAAVVLSSSSISSIPMRRTAFEARRDKDKSSTLSSFGARDEETVRPQNNTILNSLSSAANNEEEIHQNLLGNDHIHEHIEHYLREWYEDENILGRVFMEDVVEDLVNLGNLDDIDLIMGIATIEDVIPMAEPAETFGVIFMFKERGIPIGDIENKLDVMEQNAPVFVDVQRGQNGNQTIDVDFENGVGGIPVAGVVAHLNNLINQPNSNTTIRFKNFFTSRNLGVAHEIVRAIGHSALELPSGSNLNRYLTMHVDYAALIQHIADIER